VYAYAHRLADDDVSDRVPQLPEWKLGDGGPFVHVPVPVYLDEVDVADADKSWLRLGRLPG
jgi:hypothetical protein